MPTNVRPYTQAVADNLAHLIDSSGMTVEEVADAAGVYRMVLRRKLTGRAAFNTDELEAVGGVLGVGPFTLMMVAAA